MNNSGIDMSVFRFLIVLTQFFFAFFFSYFSSRNKKELKDKIKIWEIRVCYDNPWLHAISQ